MRPSESVASTKLKRSFGATKNTFQKRHPRAGGDGLCRQGRGWRSHARGLGFTG
ncbi:hypothetical protein HMPREF9120_02796 [Neisseria sp. oral taxon 020 str. F0370]|nr:hypothetical protein HMPREF9120_02796 [Neisseria sp. oral taxon 020 str. F0370]